MPTSSHSPGKKRSHKAGLPPGSLVHIGEQKVETARITAVNYDDQRVEERILQDAEECLAYKDRGGVTWINIDGLHQPDVLEKIGKVFGLHPLMLEDIANTEQRPKLEDYSDYLYVVVRMLYRSNDKIFAEQLSLVIGKNVLISFQERHGTEFDPIRERLRNGKGRARRLGVDFLAYQLIDAVIDNYFIVLERLSDEVETLEEQVIASPKQEALQKLHGLKKSMSFLRRSTWPLREVIAAMQRGDSPLIGEPMRVYLRDIYDHVVAVADAIDSMRDLLNGMLEIHMSNMNIRLNEVMKVLTIVTTLFIPATFIAGVYGMNFKYMPELDWPPAYPVVLVSMVAVAGAMYLYFKRKKWF
ncbi:MAG: magnesium/cobalt transporter CorA [Gammaproteobacteria bacterium]|nr:magnesium/cobalt transporter CorA [Gammaproteobacteria bacterium]